MNGILHRKWPNGFKYHSYIMEVKLGVQLLRPFWRQWALTILLCPIRTWKLYKPPKAQKYEATLKRQSWHYYLYLYFWPLFKNWGINLAFSKRRVTKLKISVEASIWSLGGFDTQLIIEKNLECLSCSLWRSLSTINIKASIERRVVS